MMKFTKRYLWLGFFISLVYVFSVLSMYVNPKYGGAFTLAAIAFPIVFCLQIIYGFICLFINKKWGLIFIGLLLFGFNNIKNSVAFNVETEQYSKPENTIRLLSWNVNNFGDQLITLQSDSNSIRNKMLAFIKQQNPDIICLQDEVLWINHGTYLNDLITLDSMGYRYNYFSKDCYTAVPKRDTTQVYGSVILSKTPLTHFVKTTYPLSNFYESIISADAVIKGKKFRVYTTHLRSLNLTVEEDDQYQSHNRIVNIDSTHIYHRSKIHKLIYFDKQHQKQAVIAKQVLDSCSLPNIFCADLNSVPTGYVYQYLKEGYKDAFVEKGSGFGTSYHAISPTLRIDVTFFSKQFEILNYYSPKLNLSDHYPIVVDFRLP